MSDDEYENVEEQKYGIGKGDYDRISHSVCNITNIANISKKYDNNGNFITNIERSILSEKDKMCLKIEGFSRYIIDTFPRLRFNVTSIETIVNYLDKIENKPIKSINAQTLVLAHLIVSSEDKLSLLQFISTEILPHLLPGTRITKADIIRYVRMIDNLVT